MKITTYNVPFEQTSRDRIVNKALLDPFKVEDTPDADFSYNIGNSTTATITITGKKANYIKIDESAVDVKDRILRTPITYWFATVKTIESGEAITYDCKLDVVLTYFISNVHQELNGDVVPVNVQRFHEDRYKIEGNDIVLDPEFIATKVGEFDYKGKNGNVINYKTNTVNDVVFEYVPIDSLETYVEEDILGHYNAPNFHTKGDINYYHDQTDPSNPADVPFKYPLGGNQDVFWLTIKNEYGKLVFNDWIWNVAKGVQTIGQTIKLLDGGEFTVALNTFLWTKTPNKYVIVMTTNKGNDDKIQGYARQGVKYGQASGSFIVEAKKDANLGWVYTKVNNTFFKNGQRYFSYAILQSKEIKTNDTVSQILTNGSHITIAPIDLSGLDKAPNSLKKFEDLTDGAVLNIFLSPFQLDFMPFYENVSDAIRKQLFFKKIDAAIDIYHGYIDQDQYKEIEDIIGNEIDLHSNNKLILKAEKTADNLNKVNEWDVAMLPTLSITQHVSQFSQELDIVNYNFFQRNRIDVITNELGLNFKIFNNKYKYSLFTENNYISFFTNQSSSYLATHKGQIEAQKKRIDLEKDLAIKGVQASQASNFGGGIIGAGMGAINPASYVNLSLLGETKQMYRDLAQNKKDTIQAQINDLKNTPSIRNLGNEHTLNIMQTTGNGTRGVGQFFTEVEIPNKAILSKINQYLKRYGYKYDGYIVYTASLIESRETFNFLSIKDIRDELTADEMFDDNAIELMDKELEAGIRIWHKGVCDYSQRNLEKKLIV